MDDIKVSCIVPVYKVKKEFLKRCIESLIEQTLKNIEIILIDDGSPDECGEICDKYARVDYRIKVIHQKNKGLAGARNSGTIEAKGKYITYIDGDDFIYRDGLEKLYIIAEKNNCDIVRGQFYKKFPSREEKIECKNIEKNKVYNENEIFYLKKHVLDFTANISSACGAIYKRELIIKNEIFNNERLKQGSEDVEFSFRLYDYAKRVVISSEYFYNYIYNENSISAFSSDENNLKVVECFREILKNIDRETNNKNKKELIKQFNIRLQYVIVTTAISGIFHPDNKDNFENKRKKIQQFLKIDIIKESFKYKFINKVDIKRKVILFLLKFKLYHIIDLLGKIRKKTKIKGNKNVNL